jgi:hypothetical protein
VDLVNRRRMLVVIAGLGMLALIGLAWAIFPQDLPTALERHADGEGPLGSLGVPGHDSMSVDPASGATTWTFGLRLCKVSGQTSPVLQSMSPIKEVGTGFRYLGSGVRLFRVSDDDSPLIGVDGWPPPKHFVPDRIAQLSGFVVSTDCSAGERGSDYTELLIGLERVGTDGGGWEGIEIRYSMDGRSYTLLVDHDMKICGASVSCEIPDE